MMNREEYRAKFAEYLGDPERYRKFVAQLNKSSRGRLAYWQEKEVVDFSGQLGVAVPEYGDLKDIFNICELHGELLLDGSVKVFRGHVDYSRAYEQAIIDSFPNSYLNEINGPLEQQGQSINIKYCPACRVACEGWQVLNA